MASASDTVEPIDKDTRVAWIFPFLARTHYWQPVFREFTRLIPHTTIFTGLWGGFAVGYEGTFDIHVIKGARTVRLRNNNLGEAYESTFFWAPLSILKHLAKFRPHVIFTTGFSAWTMCTPIQTCEWFNRHSALGWLLGTLDLPHFAGTPSVSPLYGSVYRFWS